VPSADGTRCVCKEYADTAQRGTAARIQKSSVTSTTTPSRHFSSTDFSHVADITRVSNAKWASEKGQIQWKGDINAQDADFESNVKIGDGFVSVNTAALHESIDSPATVSMEVENCGSYRIYYSSGFHTNIDDIISNGKICNEESSPSCTNIRCSGNILAFDVEHFDSYGVIIPASYLAFTKPRSCVYTPAFRGCQVFDYDGDGFKNASFGCVDCFDCDDSDRAVNPGADEISGDHKDNNCNGVADEMIDSDSDDIIDSYMIGTTTFGVDACILEGWFNPIDYNGCWYSILNRNLIGWSSP
jgi:hypothetical protein